MSVKRSWHLLNPFTRFQKKQSLSSIHSVETFRLILERERTRADRYGGKFSLLLFDLGNTERDDDGTHRLVRVVTDRVRACDEVGWFDKHRIGAVLPGTCAEGAQKLAHHVCHAIDGSKPPPASTVHTYPSEWLREATANLLDHSCAKSQSGEHVTSAVRSDKMKTRECTTPTEGIRLLSAPRMPAWKRAVDITGALLGFILVLPIFLLIAILIKIVSPGPVFFKQQRVGHLGKLFTCWKFRTMSFNADASIHELHLKGLINAEKPMTKLDSDDDSRIIPFGNLLRQTGLDELPQLINVLRGEMSLIGPRPPIPYEANQYFLWERRRFDTMPGLTGLWQVSGKNKTTFKEMMRLDIKYAMQRSFWMDVKIFLKTFPAIVTQFSDYLSTRRNHQYAKTN